MTRAPAFPARSLPLFACASRRPADRASALLSRAPSARPWCATASRRRVREAVRLRLDRLNPQWSIVINPRRKALDAPIAELQREVETALSPLQWIIVARAFAYISLVSPPCCPRPAASIRPARNICAKPWSGMARQKGCGWACAAWRDAIRFTPAVSIPSGNAQFRTESLLHGQNRKTAVTATRRSRPRKKCPWRCGCCWPSCSWAS